MTAASVLNAVYSPAENGWIDASIRELPDVVTCAPPEENIREWLADALREYCLALQDDGQPIPLGAASPDDLIRALA